MRCFKRTFFEFLGGKNLGAVQIELKIYFAHNRFLECRQIFVSRIFDICSVARDKN